MRWSFQFAKMKTVNVTCRKNHAGFLLTSLITYRTNTSPSTKSVLYYRLVTFCYVSIHVPMHNV